LSWKLILKGKTWPQHERGVFPKKFTAINPVNIKTEVLMADIVVGKVYGLEGESTVTIQTGNDLKCSIVFIQIASIWLVQLQFKVLMPQVKLREIHGPEREIAFVSKTWHQDKACIASIQIGLNRIDIADESLVAKIAIREISRLKR